MANQREEPQALAVHAQDRRRETGIPRVAMVQGAIPGHQLAAVHEPMIIMPIAGERTR